MQIPIVTALQCKSPTELTCRRYEDLDAIDAPELKPTIRAIIEMSDELTPPEINDL